MPPTPTKFLRKLRARVDPTPGPREQGFVLLEELVAISLLVIVMAALATFFLTVVQSTTYERAKQSAVQLANTQMDTIRSIPPATLTAGLPNAATTSQYSAAQSIPAIAPYLTSASMTAASGAGTTQTVASQTTRTANNITYTISDYLGTCSVLTTTPGASNACTTTPTSTAAGVPYLRAVVAVTWPGSRCPVVTGAGLCSYVTSSLVSMRPDPQFVLADLAPAVPLVANPGPQVTTVSANVSLQLTLQPTTGVPTTTWAVTSGTLPAGLVMTPAGLISGTATTASTAALTVTATDAFLRQATASFTWTVVPPPTITGLTALFIATAGATITPQPLTYTCPTAPQAYPGIGANCTETLTGAPSGIGIATTRSGPFLPSVTVADTGGSGPLYLGGVVDTTTTGGTMTSNTYAGDVVAQGASNYWKLDDTTAGTAVDSIAGSQNNPMVEQTGVTQNAPGASLASSDRSATFNGTLKGWAAEQTQIAAPSTFSESIWFKTTSTSGGKLMGFGDSNNGPSLANDRQIYMDNTGVLRFGNWQANTGASHVVTSAASYNDGVWHQAVGQMSPAGLSLYVDGSLVATDSTAISPYASNGYWRIGGDTLTNSWPGNFSSTYFTGSLDDASIYPTALTSAQIQQQYSDSGRTVVFSPAVTPTAGATVTGTAVTGTPNTSSWTVNAPPTVTGLTTPFTTTAGATVANQTLPYTCPTGSCTFALAGAPTGIGLSTSPTGAGPFAATATITSGPSSGNLYLRGTVDPAAATSAAYANDVAAQGATNYWHLNEASGTSGADAIGGAPLTESAGVGHGAPGAIFTAPGTASTFDGSSLGTARSQTLIPAPTTFSESIWFKTTTTLGGQLIGFGDSRTDARSSSHDRQVYMDTRGRILFGVSPSGGGTPVAVSTGTFNDGAWHQAVATMQSGTGGGQNLYVDGKLVGSQPTSSTVAYSGYWRIGGDDLNSWPAGPASNFTGTLDEASIYLTTALTPGQILQQYNDGVAASYAVTVTPADTVTGFAGLPNNAAWTVNPVPTVTGMVTPFTTTAGATIVTQPLPYTCPSTSCTDKLSGAPTGIGLNVADTGSPQPTVATISTNSGSIFLRGTVDPAAGTSTAYAGDVQTAALGATNYWRLGEASGTNGTDQISGGSNLVYSSGVGHGAPGAIFTSPDTASTFSGAADGSGTASSQATVSAPAQLTESIWFKTTTTAGGWLMGLTDQKTGSSNYDRALYLDNAGHVNLELYNGSVFSVTSSAASYNDGAWHQAVATVSPTLGVSVYVDGALASVNSGYRAIGASGVYWRLGGGGRLSTDLSSISPVSSNNFQGSLDEAAVFSTVLGANDVSKQYLDAKRVTYSLTATPTDATTSVTGPVNAATWAVKPAPAVSGLVTPVRHDGRCDHHGSATELQLPHGHLHLRGQRTGRDRPLRHPDRGCGQPAAREHRQRHPLSRRDRRLRTRGLVHRDGDPDGHGLRRDRGGGHRRLDRHRAGDHQRTDEPLHDDDRHHDRQPDAALHLPERELFLHRVGQPARDRRLTHHRWRSSVGGVRHERQRHHLPGRITVHGRILHRHRDPPGHHVLDERHAGHRCLDSERLPHGDGAHPVVQDHRRRDDRRPATDLHLPLHDVHVQLHRHRRPHGRRPVAHRQRDPEPLGLPGQLRRHRLPRRFPVRSGHLHRDRHPEGHGFGPERHREHRRLDGLGPAHGDRADPVVQDHRGHDDLQPGLTFTCPSANCTFTAAGTPSGIGVSLTTAGAAATSVAVTTTSGTIYLVGTVDSGAVPGAYTVSVTPRDATSSTNGPANTAAWTLRAQPTITGLTNPYVTTVGAVIPSQTLPYTCPTSTCSYTLTGAPSGIGLATSSTGTTGATQTVTTASGNLYLRGTVAASAGTSAAYANDVTGQGANHWWRLGESSGTTGVDSIAGGTNLTEQAGVGHGAAGAIATNSDGASTFDGSSADGSASTQTQIAGPQVFSESLWFKTTTTSGGRLFGFSNTTSGLSSNYDRQISLDNAGHLSFGTCASNGCPTVVATTGTYNDGLWHQAVGTLSSAGMSFFVDGSLIGTNTSITTAQVFNGYWRLGGDNLNGWPGTAASNYFAGTLDEVSTYPTALTPAQISQQYADANSAPYTVSVTPVDTSTGTAGPSNQAAWTVSQPPTVSGLTTPFTTTAGATINSQSLPYTCPTTTCNFTLAGAPSGVGLSTTGTGPFTSPVAVTTGSGTLYLGGTVSASAAAKAYTVTVTPTDSGSGVSGNAASAAWTVRAAPTVSGLPSSASVYLGEQIPTNYITLSYTCPSLQCTFTVGGGLTGVGLGATQNATPSPSVSVTNASGSIYVSGTISAVAGNYTVTVTPLDTTTGASGTPNSAAVTNAGPTITGQTAPLTTSVGSTIANDAVSYTCPSSNCTFAVTGGPSGIGLYTSTTGTTSGTPSVTVNTSSGTLYLRGTILASTATGNSTVGISYTENTTAVSGQASSAAWTLKPAMTLTAPAALSVARGAAASKSFTYTCQTTSCTVSASGMPPGTGFSTAASGGAVAASLTVNAGTGTLYLQGTVTSSDSTGSYPITLTLTDPAGSTITATVTWTVT